MDYGTDDRSTSANKEPMSDHDNALIKMLTPLNRSHDQVAAEPGDSFIRSLSELFGSGGGLDLFGESVSEHHGHFDAVPSRQSFSNGQWQGSCKSFNTTDDELLDLSSSLSDLCTSFSDLMSRSKGHFQKNHRMGAAHRSSVTLRHEIHRLAKARKQLAMANDPNAVYGESPTTGDRQQHKRRDLDSRAEDMQRVPSVKNISDINMSPFRGSGLTNSISDITMSPFVEKSSRRTVLKSVHRALAEGNAPTLPTQTAMNKCDHVLLHGTQKSIAAGPQYLAKQISGDFSPRKPTRSNQPETVTKLEETSQRIGSKDYLCPPTRRLSTDDLSFIAPAETWPLIDDASHGEAVVVCPSRPMKNDAAVLDSCPLQTGFIDRFALFRRSQSTPVVTAASVSPPKQPSRAQSPSRTAEESSCSRSKSSEAFLPSPSSPARKKINTALVKTSKQDSGKRRQSNGVKSVKELSDQTKTPSGRVLAKPSAWKSTRKLSELASRSERHLENLPQGKHERPLKESQKSRRSFDVSESLEKSRHSTRRLQCGMSNEGSTHDKETRPFHGCIQSAGSPDRKPCESPRLVSDISIGNVDHMTARSGQSDAEPTVNARKVTPRASSAFKLTTNASMEHKEIVLPGINKCFVRVPSEGTMSNNSGNSRDVAPVSPRRFRAAFSTSNSCRGFNSKCEQDAKQASSPENQKLEKKQEDIVLPVLAAANDARDYTDSPYFSPRKPSLSLRTSQSMRHCLMDNGSVSKDAAPVSPRRTSQQSPRRRTKDFKKTKSLHHLGQNVSSSNQ